MANNSTHSVQGFKELDAALKQLTAKLEGSIVRGGLRAGANVFHQKARARLRANGSVDEGHLDRSIRVSTKAKKGRLSARITAGDAKAFYAHMVEYGTKQHLIKAKDAKGNNKAAGINARGGALRIGGSIVSSAEHPGSRAKPFMRPALDEGVDPALQAMAAYIRKRLTKKGIGI